jgi:VIT1/CCC1 family predicted Fe2+/Mn2+ transporter
VDAEELVELLMENKEAFLELMCVYELGIMPKDSGSSPLKDGLVTFISFLICSAIPMLAYVFCFAYDQTAGLNYLFWISIALFVLTLFSLGAVKGVITNSGWLVSGIVTLIQVIEKHLLFFV